MPVLRTHQTRYLWIKGNNMYYTKGPTDDLKNANSVPIVAILCVCPVSLCLPRRGLVPTSLPGLVNTLPPPLPASPAAPNAGS